MRKGTPHNFGNMHRIGSIQNRLSVPGLGVEVEQNAKKALSISDRGYVCILP